MMSSANRCLFALGRIIVEMGNLELILSASISSVLKIEYGLALSIYAGESIETMLKIFESTFAYAIRDEKPNAELRELLKRIRDINEKRNYYIHSIWLLTDRPSPINLKLKRGKKSIPMKWDMQEVDVSNLEELVHDIAKVHDDLMTFTTIHLMK